MSRIEQLQHNTIGRKEETVHKTSGYCWRRHAFEEAGHLRAERCSSALLPLTFSCRNVSTTHCTMLVYWAAIVCQRTLIVSIGWPTIRPATPRSHLLTLNRLFSGQTSQPSGDKVRVEVLHVRCLAMANTSFPTQAFMFALSRNQCTSLVRNSPLVNEQPNTH